MIKESPTPTAQHRLSSLLRQPVAWGALLVWIAISVGAMWLIARYGLPFQARRPSETSMPPNQSLLGMQFQAVYLLLLIGIAWFLTRHRQPPDLAARAPERTQTLREVALLVGYGILAQLVGRWLGLALGWHPIGLHLSGTLYGLFDPVSTTEVWGWAFYNLIVYACLPYLYFRWRGYSNTALSLHSANPRADLWLIVIILAIEATVELSVNGALLGLSTRQLLLGMPLAFAVNFIGTVLPIMIYLICLLLPRFLKLTGSLVSTVVLVGLVYALLHTFDAWTLYTSPVSGTLSFIFVLLEYFPPGMVKAVLTLRTGNAWVHAWAFHAIAPHVTGDTPMFVKIFGIK